MKVLSSVIVLFILLTGIPVYALDLDSSNLINNIIRSLDTERDHWIIRSHEAFYMRDRPTKKTRNTTWPDMEPGCLIDFSFYVMRGDKSFISFDKPKDFHLTMHKGEEKRLVNKMRQVMYEELHNRYKIRMPKPKPVKKDSPKDHGTKKVGPFGKL